MSTLDELIKEKNELLSFKEEIYELAFGDNAINRDFSDEEVIEKIKEFSDNALKWEEMYE